MHRAEAHERGHPGGASPDEPSDDDAIRASVAEPERFGPLFDRHAGPVNRYLAGRNDTILTLQGDSPDETLTVQVVPRRDPDLLLNVMGAREERRVTVGGREARLIRTDEMWFLQAEVTGGAVVNLQAPLRLSAGQVVAIAEQISVTPRRP